MLPKQGTADDNGNGQFIILQKCDLKLRITHRHREGIARVMFYICISSPVKSKLNVCRAVDNSKYDRLKSLLLFCRSGSGRSLPASPLEHQKNP